MPDETLADLDAIRARLANWYKTPGEIDLWLSTQNEMLDGWRPHTLIQVGRGADVLRLINQIDEGANV